MNAFKKKKNVCILVQKQGTTWNVIGSAALEWPTATGPKFAVPYSVQFLSIICTPPPQRLGKNAEKQNKMQTFEQDKNGWLGPGVHRKK